MIPGLENTARSGETLTLPIFAALTGDSMCNRTTLLSWASTQYWNRHGVCPIEDIMEEHLGEFPPYDKDCKFLMDQVGERGEKTLTAFLGQAALPTASIPDSTSETNSEGAVESGLSISEIAGIGVGVPLFVIICATSGFLLLRRKRHNDADFSTEAQLPELVQPAQQHQRQLHDLPEVQTLLRP